ncbi:hypothetical protein ACRVDG_20135, partial [Acinetobacter baumannii]
GSLMRLCNCNGFAMGWGRASFSYEGSGMKPEQFIREYGVENVKTLIEDYEKDQFKGIGANKTFEFSRNRII